MKRAAWIAAALVAILVAALTFAAVVPPEGPRALRRFEPNRVADLEVGMWQAYYTKDRTRLFGLLVTMLREQYHYSWATAAREGFYLARAAATFGNARGNYDTKVLPDLVTAYSISRDWLGADFDPKAVARAELAWWVARRVPGQNGPEHVGALMARSYALLYDAPESKMMPAALLRAQAARLRDTERLHPDWPTIRLLLRQSYRKLHAALDSERAGLISRPSLAVEYAPIPHMSEMRLHVRRQALSLQLAVSHAE